ncbi:MAG: hypothetical protein MUF03_09870 [Rubrivivax sp.]|jgi:hypothetical protein|nr:hypothetical protein [Rubrivivax sp.]
MKAILLPFAAAAMLLHAPAMAEETRCIGTLGPVYLDNIFVPDGASCVLDRTRAKGNVVVGTGAKLSARSVMVNGSVQAEGASSVRISGTSTVGGSVQIVQGGSATIYDTRINGDLQFDENVALIDARRNVIGGNLQAVKNYGGVTLIRNRMKGNLQCKENIPAPTGSGNVATSKEDQCRRL